MKEPETYNELVRVKQCMDLASHYSVSEDTIDEIYNFMSLNPANYLTATASVISLISATGNIFKSIPTYLKDSSIDGLKLTNSGFTLYPHYTPSSGSYSGGSSSNNNNNNNNNNNKNNNNNN